ncbi:MAG: cupin domain-containing protein [Actinomycetota bacterium]|nr:cupin domain-containing protein [Actinomycetota bacterium]
METWDIRSLDVQVHQPKVLKTDGEARVIAINLPSGESLKEHQVHERAYLFVADGAVEIGSGGGTETAGVGTLTHFDPNERHEVRATEDTRLVLLLAPWTGEGHSRDRAGGGDPANR